MPTARVSDDEDQARPWGPPWSGPWGHAAWGRGHEEFERRRRERSERRQQQRQARRAGHHANSQVLGGVLVAGGFVWLLREADIVTLSATSAMALVLMALGLGLVLTSRTGARSRWLIVIGLALTVVLAGSSSIDVNLRGGIGERVVHVSSVTQLLDRHDLLVGSLELDLQQLSIEELPDGTSRLVGNVSVGELIVSVPRGVPLKVDAEIGLGGEIRIFGRERNSGGRVREGFTSHAWEDAPRRLLLDLRTGVGKIEVKGDPGP